MVSLVPILVAFYDVKIMFDDDVSDVESHQKWYKEYHPGGILWTTWKCGQKIPLYIPPCTWSTGF
jgi:hypothetical protein